ncbi:FAD-dependent oxidoreductase [Kribbella sandramycini]|uniref:FAD-dependent oxidoreductase n=1 Tax=Kribbella sandramycini TaxID=60450 RepID=A0A7Y4KWD1_9ACTN|nr:FAD-dependent oxidoreductase [Kribbella sandramycini]MBB6567500.1 sarcosine oxidase [Kribbella sandramycini]NOL39893.1 FAD-dependent oxidoreductase [Kribbella sandramycini]
MTYDVAVVGAGAMGSAAARALAAAGREVVVLEQYPLGHDRGGSHGGTRLFRPAADDAELAAITEQARPLWRELEAESGETLFEVTGGIDFNVTAATVETFRALHATTGEVLTAAEASERWAGFRFSTPVLHQPGSGRLYADRTVKALQTVAARLGAEFRGQSPVAGLRRHNGLVELDVPGGAVRAAQVVVTAGCWAPRLLGGLVALPPFRVSQEQPRFFAPVSPELVWPSFVDQSVSSYGLFEEGSGVKVGLHATGPTVDPDTRDFQVEPERDAELIRYVESTFPGLDTGRTTANSCLYDNTPSGAFVIDRSGPITVAAGFCGSGFKFVPLVGQYVRDLVTGAAGVPERFRLSSHQR